MSEEVVFAMGEFLATFPTDRLYAKNHMWGHPKEDGTIRFGFSAYAVRLLQDVYFLEWAYEAPCEFQERQRIGSIESKKAESDLFAPVRGTLVRWNDELLSDPSLINVDKYGAGWLFELRTDSAPLLTPDRYLEHLSAAWVVAQRTIKGQMNEE